MTTIAEFDIDELVIQLHEELKLAFQLAQVEELSDSYQIEAVKAKMGRKDMNNVENGTNLNVLNPARYPDEEDWEIEVNYSKKDRSSRNQNTFVKRNDQFLTDNLNHLPLSSLKGISAFWQRIFAEKEVLTLGELMNFSQSGIIKLCTAQNSYFPQEFQTKILLLKHPLIVKKMSNAEKIYLKDIALSTEYDLKNTIGKSFTAIEVRMLINMINLLMMVLDKRVFNGLTLKILISSEIKIE